MAKAGLNAAVIGEVEVSLALHCQHWGANDRQRETPSDGVFKIPTLFKTSLAVYVVIEAKARLLPSRRFGVYKKNELHQSDLT